MSGEPNGWNEWGRYVLKMLEDNADDHKDMRAELRSMQNELKGMKADIAGLKVRAGLWGAVAGAIPVIVALVVKLV